MWAFLDSGYLPGAANMAYDEQLVLELSRAELEGVVRVYGWTPPCISLGYHQNFRGIDLDKCRREGIDLVKRPTGGRAILHWEEITYSVVMRGDRRPTAQVYHAIGLALESGLRWLHPGIALAKLDAHDISRLSPTSSIPCFASTARCEIQFGGKKLVGSAQRRYRVSRRDENSGGGFEEIILQHGSILLGPAHLRLVEFLFLEDEQQARILWSELGEKSTELSSILQRQVEYGEVSECLKRGFEKAWGIRFEEEAGETIEFLSLVQNTRGS
jgi:lipoate-protein ligase A